MTTTNTPETLPQGWTFRPGLFGRILRVQVNSWLSYSFLEGSDGRWVVETGWGTSSEPLKFSEIQAWIDANNLL